MKNIKTYLLITIASLSMNCSAMTGSNAQKVAYNVVKAINYQQIAKIVPKVHVNLATLTQLKRSQNHLATTYFTPSSNTNNTYSKLAAGILAVSLATSITYADEEKHINKEIDIILRNGNELYIYNTHGKPPYNQSPYRYVSVKNKENKVIATAEFAIHPKDNESEGFDLKAVILNIEVSEEYKNQGIGSAIMQAIMNFAKSNNCGLAQLYSINDTKYFYETLGFIATEIHSPCCCNMKKKL